MIKRFLPLLVATLIASPALSAPPTGSGLQEQPERRIQKEPGRTRTLPASTKTPLEKCRSLLGQLNTDKHKPAVCSGLAREITDLNCYGLTSNAVYADPQKKVCDVTQCQALWSQLATQRTTSACVGLVTQIQNLSCYQVTQNSVYNLPAATAYCSGN